MMYNFRNTQFFLGKKNQSGKLFMDKINTVISQTVISVWLVKQFEDLTILRYFNKIML